MNTYLVLVSFFLLLSVGLYLLLCDCVKMPSLAATRAALHITQRDKKNGQWQDTLVLQMSTQVSKLIHLSDYRKRKMSTTLKNAGISLTPEIYYSKAFVRAFLKLCLSIIPSLLFPFMFPLFFIWAASTLLEDLNEAEKTIKKRREEIERELPRFVATVAQEMSASRDVLSMLEGYKSSARGAFRDELETTIADMKSLSSEKALTRLEARIDSTMLSQVVRGLQLAVHGDDSVVHFAMLSNDFKQLEIQRLKREALKRPGKVKVFSFLLLGCFILMYGVVIIVQLNGSMKNFF
jgi:D-mannonate dehydratase